jgi:hypothetical protein
LHEKFELKGSLLFPLRIIELIQENIVWKGDFVYIRTHFKNCLFTYSLKIKLPHKVSSRVLVVVGLESEVATTAAHTFSLLQLRRMITELHFATFADIKNEELSKFVGMHRSHTVHPIQLEPQSSRRKLNTKEKLDFR